MDKITKQAAEQALRDLDANGGGTYDASDGHKVEPSTGYAVAIGGIELARAGLTAEQLRWAGFNAASEYGTDLFGTWLNEGIVYIDAVRYITNRDEAILLGQEAGQLAIYDFGTKEAIDL